MDSGTCCKGNRADSVHTGKIGFDIDQMGPNAPVYSEYFVRSSLSMVLACA